MTHSVDYISQAYQYEKIHKNGDTVMHTSNKGFGPNAGIAINNTNIGFSKQDWCGGHYCQVLDNKTELATISNVSKVLAELKSPEEKRFVYHYLIGLLNTMLQQLEDAHE